MLSVLLEHSLGGFRGKPAHFSAFPIDFNEIKFIYEKIFVFARGKTKLD